jgi:micrococcal nuclease
MSKSESTEVKPFINLLPRKFRLLATLLVTIALAGFAYISTHSTLPVSSTPGMIPVVKVVDGDTIDVKLDGHTQRIRLIGVDTPEVVDPRKPVQCFGKQASVYTHSVLDNQQVKLATDPTQDNKDVYGRLLRYVYLADGTLFNLQLIQQGYAHEYTFQVPYQFQDQFRQAQAQARQQNKGLWSPTTCGGITN